MRSTFVRWVGSSAVALCLLGLLFVTTGCEGMGSSCNPCNTCNTPSPCNTCNTGCNTCPKPCAPPCAPPPCAPPAAPVAMDCGNCGPFPANAQPGEAWCCVFVPPEYKTETDRVCTCPEQVEKIWNPPKYETRTKQVMTCAEQKVPRCIPAVMRTVEECIETCPARTEWQRVECTPSDPGAKQGECWALVTIPPQFEKRTKQVCETPEQTVYDTIPAKYETVTEQVEVACGFYTDKVTPAVYEDRPRQVCVRDGKWEWRKNTACAVPNPAANMPANPCAK